MDSCTASQGAVLLDPSLYRDALHQLHLNQVSLQETTAGLLREQARLQESLARMQGDLEQAREGQNSRLEDMTGNIDADLKKVRSDLGRRFDALEDRMKTNLCDVANIAIEDVKEVKTEMARVKELVLENSAKTTCDVGALALEMVEEVARDLGVLEREARQKMGELGVVVEGAKRECIGAMEEYIGVEVVETVVASLERKVCQVREEVRGEVEETRIRVEDMAAVYARLKNKVAELENPRRTFDDTDLYSCSVDENMASPFRLEDERASRPPHKTPSRIRQLMGVGVTPRRRRGAPSPSLPSLSPPSPSPPSPGRETSAVEEMDRPEHCRLVWETLGDRIQGCQERLSSLEQRVTFSRQPLSSSTSRSLEHLLPTSPSLLPISPSLLPISPNLAPRFPSLHSPRSRCDKVPFKNPRISDALSSEQSFHSARTQLHQSPQDSWFGSVFSCIVSLLDI